MNYRKENVRFDSARLRRMTALCVALAVLAVGLGAWAVVAQVRLSKLTTRVEELEAERLTGAPTEEVGASSGVQTGALNYDPNTVVAEFDGGTVTAGEAVPEYETLMSYYAMLGVDSAEVETDAKMTVLSGLVESKVLALKAEELGLSELTDEERAQIEAQGEANYEENVNYYMQFRTGEGMSEEDARAETVAYLAENGMTPESAVEEALKSATEERLRDYVASGQSVDDAQLRAFYDEQLESAELTYTADYTAYELDSEASVVLWNPEGVRRVQVLMIPFDANQSVEYLSLSAAAENGEEGSQAELDALYDALRPAAEQALSRVKAGEDFSALMAELGSYGPDEGICMSAQSEIYGTDLRDAAMALENIGDTSDIVRIEGGLCILRYASDVTPGAVPFEQVAEELRSGYEDELKQSQYNAAVVQWIADANVQYYTDRF